MEPRILLLFNTVLPDNNSNKSISTIYSLLYDNTCNNNNNRSNNNNNSDNNNNNNNII